MHIQGLVCVSCCWPSPGTSAPSVAHLMVSLYLCCSGSNARGKPRALEGHCASSKSPSRVRDGDEGVAGRNGREYCFPDEGSLICPPGKSMIFHKKETEKNEFVARTEVANWIHFYLGHWGNGESVNVDGSQLWMPWANLRERERYHYDLFCQNAIWRKISSLNNKNKDVSLNLNVKIKKYFLDKLCIFTL